MPSITNMATTTALTAVENKIPNHSKYTTTPEFKKLTVENFTANLATKGDIAGFVKKTDVNDKLKNFLKNFLVENK